MSVIILVSIVALLSPLSVTVTVIVPVSAVKALTVILPLPSTAAVQFDVARDSPKVFSAVPLAAKL